MLQQGLSRLDCDGEMLRMDEVILSTSAIEACTEALSQGRLFLLLDRLAVDGSKRRHFATYRLCGNRSF